MIARLKLLWGKFRVQFGAGLVALVGVADAIGMIDIAPLIRLVFSSEDTVGVVLAIGAIVIGLMHYYAGIKQSADNTPSKGVDEGN